APALIEQRDIASRSAPIDDDERKRQVPDPAVLADRSKLSPANRPLGPRRANFQKLKAEGGNSQPARCANIETGADDALAHRKTCLVEFCQVSSDISLLP